VETRPQLARAFEFASHVAFDELDMQGILHHSRHLLHVERACHAFFTAVMGAEGFRPDLFQDLNAVVRRLNIEYLRPLAGVVPITVALWVTRLRSCTMTTASSSAAAMAQPCIPGASARSARENRRTAARNVSDAYLARFGEWVSREPLSASGMSKGTDRSRVIRKGRLRRQTAILISLFPGEPVYSFVDLAGDSRRPTRTPHTMNDITRLRADWQSPGSPSSRSSRHKNGRTSNRFRFPVFR
jgi:acyl-CoA thioesterase FadM